jgi:cysteine desulfurase / selenocysteine lyase
MSALTDAPAQRVRKIRPAAFDVGRVRADFPILRQEVHGKPLVYLDNAATTQKPQAVLDALVRYYTEDNANIHRGLYQLSERSTRAYEEARAKVQRFLNARETYEVIFVRGCTEAINLVAQTYGRQHLQAGDEILLTALEHHSNIVPWQMVCQQTGAVLRVVPVDDAGELLLEEYERLLSPRTRLVAVAHASNALGTINPVRRLIELAHRRGVPVLLDGAQAVPHLPVDVQELDCDFYAFSGHKVFGPTGIGVLYGKAALLEAIPPYQGGGDMIHSVTFEQTTYADLPNKFEAGTPHIAGAVGLGAAVDYFQALGLANVAPHEEELLRAATEGLRQIPGVRVIGTAAHKVAVLSFVVEDPPLSALDVGAQLDLEGVAIRTGHHCCQPLMNRYGIPGTARASFALYNTLEEVEQLVTALRQIVARARRPAPAPAPTAAEPAYPKAYAASPQAGADKLAAAFDFFDDWAERYQQLIDMGKKLPPMPAELKAEANRVHGCQSTVYLSARQKPGTGDTLEFLAESDADIVNGLIALLQKVYSGQKASDIGAFDVEGFFDRLGLDRHLTLGRRNGLASMVKRIRSLAAALLPAGSARP